MFRALDRNGDGRINPDELDMAVASLRTLDKDKDGQLTIQELFPIGPNRMGRPGTGGTAMGRPEGNRPGAGGRQMPSPEQMFSQFDRDGDGTISKSEAPDRLAQNFDRVDADGDGKLTSDEINRVRQQMMRAGGRGRDGRGQSDEPAGGTRPRRPEAEE